MNTFFNDIKPEIVSLNWNNMENGSGPSLRILEAVFKQETFQ